MKQLKELIEASILGDIDININDVDKYLNDAEQQLIDIKEQILKKPEWETWQASKLWQQSTITGPKLGKQTYYVTIVSAKYILEYFGINNWNNLKFSIIKFPKGKTWTINILLHDFPSNKSLATIELPITKYSTFKTLCKKYLCEEVFKDINTFSKFIKDNYNK
jgi:hypothetical protein